MNFDINVSNFHEGYRAMFLQEPETYLLFYKSIKNLFTLDLVRNNMSG